LIHEPQSGTPSWNCHKFPSARIVFEPVESVEFSPMIIRNKRRDFAIRIETTPGLWKSSGSNYLSLYLSSNAAIAGATNGVSRVAEEKAGRCAWVGCSQPPIASLEKRSLCAEHFLEMAVSRIDSIEASVNDQSGARDVHSDVQSVLAEMMSQIPTVVTGTRRLKPELRDRFMSLSETALKLYKAARRPPRFDRSVTCQVRLSVLSSEVPLRCSTLNVSQRGASVETTHPFQKDQVVALQREDTGKRANAKVVWVKKRQPKGFMVGLEILDQEDFWGLGQFATRSVVHLPAAATTEPEAIKKTK
jgi:hypothetical protein